jgi:flagellar hook-length control protein FliK
VDQAVIDAQQVTGACPVTGNSAVSLPGPSTATADLSGVSTIDVVASMPLAGTAPLSIDGVVASMPLAGTTPSPTDQAALGSLPTIALATTPGLATSIPAASVPSSTAPAAGAVPAAGALTAGLADPIRITPPKSESETGKPAKPDTTTNLQRTDSTVLFAPPSAPTKGGDVSLRPASASPPLPTALATGNAMERAVAHQVSQSLLQQLPSGERVLVVRLTPPELGTVRIEVVEHANVFSVRLHAEDDGVRLALERCLPQLRQDLRAHDAPIRDLSLADHTGFDRAFAEGQGQPRGQTNPLRQATSDDVPFTVEGLDPPPATSATGPRQLGGRIDAMGVDVLV